MEHAGESEVGSSLLVQRWKLMEIKQQLQEIKFAVNLGGSQVGKPAVANIEVHN